VGQLAGGLDAGDQLFAPLAQGAKVAKSSDCPKKTPKRMDMAGVIARCPSTISLMARGGTEDVH
jgi:hypothetical protein